MNKNNILLALSIILLPILILLFSYQTTVFLIDKTPAQQNTINYLQNKEELQLNYTSSELSHLQDVKAVMNTANLVFYITLLAAIFLLTYSFRDKKQVIRLLRWGGIATIIFILIILAAILISFSYTFTLFHQLFFPQGNWLFSADSLLIQAFPLEFFVRISYLIFLQTLGLGIVIALLSGFARIKLPASSKSRKI